MFNAATTALHDHRELAHIANMRDRIRKARTMTTTTDTMLTFSTDFERFMDICMVLTACGAMGVGPVDGIMVTSGDTGNPGEHFIFVKPEFVDSARTLIALHIAGD